MPEMEELRKAVITNIRACLISSQGGISISSLNNDYKQILGETVPFKKLGYNNIESFLKSVPEIKLTTANGAVLVEANKTAASNHVSSLVQRQKRSGRRRPRKSQRLPHSQRLPQRPNKPTALPPRFQKAPKIPGRNKPKETPPNKTVPKNIDKCGPPARTSQSLSHSANTISSVSRHGHPPPVPPPLFQKPIPPPEYMPLPHYPPGLSHPIQPYYPHQEPQHLPHVYPPQHLLHPVPHYEPIPPLIRNLNQDLILKRQPTEIVQQFPQMEKNDIRIKSRLPPHKSGPKSIIDRLPIPTNLSKDSYYHKLLEICKKRDWPEPEICLLKQKGGIVTCTVSLKFYKTKTGITSEASTRKLQDFSTYPDEIRDAVKALEEGSKKAYDSVSQMVSDSHPVTKDRDTILERVGEMVAGKLNGVWAFQIEGDYIEKYKESLPPKWIEIVRDSGVVCASDLGHSFVVTPITNEDKLKMVSPCSYKKVNTDIPKLIPPESDQWDVFLSKAYSYSEVWIRLIGENYSEQLENLTTEIELYYFGDKNPSISEAEIDHYYVAICDNSAYRVQVKECHDTEVLVHFIDYGDFEVLSLNVLKHLAPKFYKLPAQALQVNLAGLEYCAKLDYRDDVMDKIVAKSYIAVVEERDPYYLVLYDTSENNDLDINKMLIDNIFSEILNKSNNLKVGTVKEVRICHIDDNGQVFIQLAGTAALEILEDRLTTFDKGECETCKSTKINFNKFYLVEHLGKHKRVMVNPTNNFSKQNMDVYFVDEGKTSTVPVSDLLEINDDYDVLHFIPHQALKIYLKDIPPFKLTKSKITKLREIAPPNMPIISKVVELTDLPVLELFIRNQTDKLLASVNHSIELEDLLDSSNGDNTSVDKSFQHLRISDLSPNKSNSSSFNSSSHINPSKATVIQEQDIYKWDFEGDIIAAHRTEIPPVATGYFEIYVSDAANPDNFTVLPTKYLHELNKLTEEMTHYYDNMKPNVSSPLQYDVFAMKHTDGFWYRAVLYRVLNDSITVRLCDYGNLDIVQLKNLRPLHKRFMKLPFVGFKAALWGIAPKHRDWSVQDCMALKNMIKEKKLISVVKEVTQIKDELVLHLEITDTTSNNDINISHQLVIEGRAIYT